MAELRQDEEQEQTQAEISATAPPGTPATRDRAAVQRTGALGPAPLMVPDAPPQPVMPPATASPVVHTSTTAAPRPPEGPIVQMLRRKDNPDVTLSAMPIDAQDHLASGEWELVPPREAKQVNEANPPESSGYPPPVSEE